MIESVEHAPRPHSVGSTDPAFEWRNAQFSRLRDTRLGRTIGIVLIALGMSLYVSPNARSVFGRWSPTFFGALLLMYGASAVSIITSLRSLRRRTRVFGASFLVDCGIAFVGGAYICTALADPSQGARVLDADLFGSTLPASALLEWLALVMIVAGVVVQLFRKTSGKALNVLLSTVAFVATLLALEGVVRLSMIAKPPTHGALGSKMWRHRYVSLNRAGMRDAEHELRSTPGVTRALVVGDSYAFGWGVQRPDARFGEQLVGRLAADGTRWESINFSEPDRHTLQEISFLQRGLAYHPDLVVLVYVFNDMDYLEPITPRPKFRNAPNGLVARLDPRRIVLTNSFLAQELYTRMLFSAAARGNGSGAAFSAYSDTNLVRRHLADLAAFVATAKRGGAVTAIVPFDIAPAFDSRALRRYESFVEAARTAGLPVVSIPHAFDGRSQRSVAVSSLDSHPSALAHQLAAEVAAPGVLRIWKARASK